MPTRELLMFWFHKITLAHSGCLCLHVQGEMTQEDPNWELHPTAPDPVWGEIFFFFSNAAKLFQVKNLSRSLRLHLCKVAEISSLKSPRSILKSSSHQSLE